MKHSGHSSVALALAAVGGLCWTAFALAPAAGSQVRAGSNPVLCHDGRVPIPSLPFTIDRCGSYFLRDCLTGQVGQHGVTIAADDVTLDLGGFTLLGVAGSLDGIHVQSGRNVRIVNGALAGWGEDGLDGFSAAGSQVQDLECSDNSGTGLALGSGGVVERATARNNGGDGIAVGFGSVVRDSAATSNSGIGIRGAIGGTTTGCVIESCTARLDAGGGIQVGDASTVRGCAVTMNSSFGVQVGPGSVVEGCAVTINFGPGISATDALVRGNSARGNSGIDIDATASTVLENH